MVRKLVEEGMRQVTASDKVDSGHLYWIDAFRVIAIVLVVVGHATGKYNAYIYAFHVPAFFFISGFVSKQDKEGLAIIIYKRIVSLLIPLFSAVLFSGLWVEILKKTGIYHLFYDEKSEASFWGICRNFILRGELIDIIGAAWFVIVLFSCSILSAVLYVLVRKKILLYFGISIMLYLYGYTLLCDGIQYAYMFDVAIVAQGYYALGFVTKKMFENVKRKSVADISSSIYYVVVLGFCTVIMCLLKQHLQGIYLMDLANRKINHIGWSSFAILNGIIWLYSLSRLIATIKVPAIQKNIAMLGKSTMGIMFFHFLGFKIVFFVLYTMKIVPKESLRWLVPTVEIGNNYWGCFVLGGLVFSLVLWYLLGRIPVVSAMFGIDKTFVLMIPQLRIWKQLANIHERISKLVVNGLREYIKPFCARGRVKATIAMVVACSMVLCAFCLREFLLVGDISLYGEAKSVYGRVEVTFPYSGKDINFSSGWLEQSDSEEYRWVRQNSEFFIYLGDQSSISMSGYIPDNVEGISKVSLYLNDNLIESCSIIPGQGLSIEAEFGDYKSEGINCFKLCFDSERIPNQFDIDQRVFSAMFSTVCIY